MQLTLVSERNQEKEFIQANVEINKNNPSYIRPLNKDVLQVFHQTKNKAFRHGEAARWVLKENNGKLIGRIAAFVNKKYKNKGDEVPVGGIGFFDCINNQGAADMLFDVAKHWLMQRGMQAMDGPINFGERDRWWGLVTKGFHPPMYGMNFNAPYYIGLFENYGFKNFYNQVCFGLDPKKKLADKIFERHALYKDNPDFKAVHIKKNQLDKFAEDFTIVYNRAWAGHGGMKELSTAVVKKMFQTMKPVMDERIDWFIYYKNNPIAIFINIPDLNEWFKYLNGKFDLFHRLKFLWIKQTIPCKKLTGLVFGIVPEWQGKGIDAYMIAEAAKIIQLPSVPYTEYEVQWIGEFNPKMINVIESIGDTFRSRMLTTYRYLFDQTKPFTPHPVIV